MLFERVRTDCGPDGHVFEAPVQWSSHHTYLLLHRTFDCLICRRPQVVVRVSPNEVEGQDLFAWLLQGTTAASDAGEQEPTA
jgi:hypothetical protein